MPSSTRQTFVSTESPPAARLTILLFKKTVAIGCAVHSSSACAWREVLKCISKKYKQHVTVNPCNARFPSATLRGGWHIDIAAGGELKRQRAHCNRRKSAAHAASAHSIFHTPSAATRSAFAPFSSPAPPRDPHLSATKHPARFVGTMLSETKAPARSGQNTFQSRKPSPSQENRPLRPRKPPFPPARTHF